MTNVTLPMKHWALLKYKGETLLPLFRYCLLKSNMFGLVNSDGCYVELLFNSAVTHLNLTISELQSLNGSEPILI